MTGVDDVLAGSDRLAGARGVDWAQAQLRRAHELAGVAVELGARRRELEQPLLVAGCTVRGCLCLTPPAVLLAPDLPPLRLSSSAAPARRHWWQR